MRHLTLLIRRLLITGLVWCSTLVWATGLNWPANQLLPTFSTPVPVLDCIDLSSASAAEIDLFTSLEGIVNRTQPRVVCASTVNGEGEFTWLNLHNLATNAITGYAAILKYQTNFTGLVVTDPSQPDTLNLATTMAGVNNELICNPSLLATLTNSPYNLAIVDDLPASMGSMAIFTPITGRSAPIGFWRGWKPIWTEISGIIWWRQRRPRSGWIQDRWPRTPR